MADPAEAAEHDPHFIGWLPTPRAYARFLAPLAIGLVVAAAAAAALIAWGQLSPGTGRWEDDHPAAFAGVVYGEPYAMIRVPGAAPSDPPKTVLLVKGGKFGAKERARPYDGQPVRVAGTLLTRDGFQMLELADGADGLQPAEMTTEEQRRLARPAPKSRGQVSLRGEIVDSKCYLGAMKPGGGTTHKGCAVLCLKGGVPPLFVTQDTGGRMVYYLLVSGECGQLDQAAFHLAGEPVEVNGESEEWGDISVLKAAGRSFRRR